MKRKRAPKRPSSSGDVPPAARQSARQQSLANKETARALARSGTRGSSANGLGSLLIWTLVFAVVAIVIVVGAAFMTRPSGGVPTGTPIPPSAITPTNIPSNGRTLGSPSAPVTIDIYGDFRCSACFVFATQGTEQSLVDNYIATGKASLVWHDFLTIDAHDGATASRDAANAAWCAADQGKFWVMHDWLYANNQSPTENPAAFTMSRLSDIGRAAGLDMSTYLPCLDQGTHDAAIAAEQASTPAQVTATPSILVNGKFVAGANANSWPTYDLIKAAIDAALASPAPSGSASESGSAAPSA
jgi:protein-disulfide isomerase